MRTCLLGIYRQQGQNHTRRKMFRRGFFKGAHISIVCHDRA